MATLLEGERLGAQADRHVRRDEQLLVELVRLVELDLRHGRNLVLLQLAAAELLDLAEPPVEGELQDGDPVLEHSVVY